MGKKFDPKAALQKHGWKEGIGLGKDNTGIAVPIKASRKHDLTGVGHDAGEQFTNCWWQQLFNKSAKNINVNVSNENITVSQSESSGDYRLRKLSAVIPSAKTNLYSSFVKTSTLHGTEEIREPVVETKEPVVTSNESEKIVTDEMLHLACGGRTAHKGARHGLKMNGKLERLIRQEEMLRRETPSNSDNDSSLSVSDANRLKTKNGDDVVKMDDDDECQHKTKSKKHKRRHTKPLVENENVIETADQCVDSNENIVDETLMESSKRKKKKKKCVDTNEDVIQHSDIAETTQTVQLEYIAQPMEEPVHSKKKSKRKHLQVDYQSNNDPCITEDVKSTSCDQNIKRKKDRQVNKE